MKITTGPLKRFALSLALVAWSASAFAQEVVKIGDLEAQTGALNTYGWMSSQGVRMAVDEINKAGGFQVGGKTYKLELASPDTQGNPQQEWTESIKRGKEFPWAGHFDYSIPLTEATLIGGLSMRFPGQRLVWDSKALKVTNHAGANNFMGRPLTGYGAG